MNPQNFIMIVGSILILVGVGLYIVYPLGVCASPVMLPYNIAFCITSPASICVLVGAALLIIGFLGQAFLAMRGGRNG